jgi:hypothetical protein
MNALRVLVTGGRDYSDRANVYLVLNRLHLLDGGIKVLIEGGARGADRLAREWALASQVPVETYPAEWETYGKSAGYRRNKQMLEEGKPDLVVAFPGGKGTANMVELATKAKVPVQRVLP